LQEKQRKSGKMKASPSACNAGKYLSPKTKHTRSDRKERNAMLALPNSHRKLCTRRAKDNGTIGKVASPVHGLVKLGVFLHMFFSPCMVHIKTMQHGGLLTYFLIYILQQLTRT
jgi:hypothetical protein